MRGFASFAMAAAALALVGCASTPAEQAAAGPFDPAACYDRDVYVYFDGRDTALNAGGLEVLDTLARDVRGCTIQSVRVTGAADAEGAASENEEVSVRRAEAIAAHLQGAGWPRNTFELLRMGERGAVTGEGLNVPMRRRARVQATIVAPAR